MKPENKRLKPPPRKPWMLDNTSSSSLRGMEIGLPPGHDVPPPAPGVVATYEAKPLPPVPTRRSGISSFSKEVQNAFRTPNASVDYHTPDGTVVIEEADIAVMLDSPSDAAEHNARFDSGREFTQSPVQVIHSLLPARSLQKLLQVTGAGSAASLPPSNTSLTPSGHNPRQKIHQIMGVEVGLGERHNFRGPAREIPPVSPESCSSSVYSQDAVETVSEPETDTHFEHEQLLTPETTVTVGTQTRSSDPWHYPSVAPSDVPASLHIVKTRSTFGQGPAVANEPRPPPNHSRSPQPHDGPYRHDLYHATVTELAQGTGSASTNSQTHNNSNRHKSNDFSYPDLYFRQPPRQQQGFSNHAYQSRVRIAPPVELSKLDTLSAPRDAQSMPIKTPYPLPRSQFDFDDDEDSRTSYDTDVSPPSRPSLITRVFKRASNPQAAADPASRFSTTASTPTPPPPPPSSSARPHLTPPPRLRDRQVKSPSSPSAHSQPYPPPLPPAFPRPPTHHATAPTTPRHSRTGVLAAGPKSPPPVPPRGTPPPPPPPPTAAPARTGSDGGGASSSSSLSSVASAAARRIGGGVARAAGGLVGRVRGAVVARSSGEEERRRAGLKGQIRVLGPGFRVGSGGADWGRLAGTGGAGAGAGAGWV